jgi:hypothetical protein
VKGDANVLNGGCGLMFGAVLGASLGLFLLRVTLLRLPMWGLLAMIVAGALVGAILARRHGDAFWTWCSEHLHWWWF